MTIDILKSAVGTNWRVFEGQRLDCPDEAFARRLIDSGFAKPVAPESAAFEPSENAARNKPHKIRR